MTSKERKKLWRTYSNAPSLHPRYIRKKKLKERWLGRIDAEIERTTEKLALLKELRDEGNV